MTMRIHFCLFTIAGGALTITPAANARMNARTRIQRTGHSMTRILTLLTSLRLFAFGMEGVNYEAESDPVQPMPGA